jgi:16S rRNA (adenine1518-N6/adenine1519-N6)-dimethyltransferase
MKAAKVLAIEKDERLVKQLRKRLAAVSNLQLISADALDYLRENVMDWSGWKVVSNLPYSVASPLLVELALSPQAPQRIVATLQLEVARRIVAGPGADDYGLLSLLLQVRYLPLGSFRIPKTCFFPEPDIDSATVILQRHAEPLLRADQIDIFVSLVKLAFSQRRKMMLKLLKTRWTSEALTQGFERNGLPATIRAEEVSLAQFVGLAQILSK